MPFMGKSFMLISMFTIHIASEYASDSIMNEGMLPLEYDYYHSTCPRAEHIIRDSMSKFIKNDTRIAPQLLRLFFHDCFILGCDASVLLDDSKGINNHQTEKDALPNLTLKGFGKIDMIKKALEDACPGVVSCSDIITMAVRDGISGGPYYPVLTGRKDSLHSYFNESIADIPRPNDNIDRILSLFMDRGFTIREIVIPSGAHNIGNINCQFMQSRFDNFQGTGHPDPSIPLDFVKEMRSRCRIGNISNLPLPSADVTSAESRDEGMVHRNKLVSAPSIHSGKVFDSHYYKNLMKGRGLLFSDQQLMADPRTEKVVRALASDNGITFRKEFVKAMIKISNLGPLTDTQGEVRRVCSVPN